MLICIQGMQQTWWSEAGTIIVTGPYWRVFYCINSGDVADNDFGSIFLNDNHWVVTELL